MWGRRWKAVARAVKMATGESVRDAAPDDLHSILWSFRYERRDCRGCHRQRQRDGYGTGGGGRGRWGRAQRTVRAAVVLEGVMHDSWEREREREERAVWWWRTSHRRSAVAGQSVSGCALRERRRARRGAEGARRESTMRTWRTSVLRGRMSRVSAVATSMPAYACMEPLTVVQRISAGVRTCVCAGVTGMK